MPEENKREGVERGGGYPPGPDLLRIRQYPDPSRPYSTESSGSSTFTQENRSRGHSTRDEMDEDLLLGLCSPLTRGLDWDTSFTSTVDVDAIKAPGPESKDEASKAPLTTIPENWESLVQDRKEQQDQSSSGSSSESDSDSGSNEDEATSSSSTSLDSDSSSEDNEDSKDQAFQFSRVDRIKHNSGESGKKGTRRSSGYKSPNLHGRNRSPNVSQRTRSPHHGINMSASPLRSPSSPSRGRKRSGGQHHRTNFHSPTSSFRIGTSSSFSSDAQQLNKSLHSRQDNSMSTALYESSKPQRPTKEEICARIFKVGNSSSSINSDLSRNDNSYSGYNSTSRQNSNGESLSLGEKVKNGNRTKQSGNTNSSNKPSESKNMTDLSEDSDDSCIILDNVPKPKHLQLDNSKSIFLEDSEYQHKMSALSAAYGRLSSRGIGGNTTGQDNGNVGNPIPSGSGKLSVLHQGIPDAGPELSESSDSSSVSSFSSCDLSVAEEQDIELVSAEPSGMLSSPEECTPPPTLEPAIPELSPTPTSLYPHMETDLNEPCDIFNSSSNSSSNTSIHFQDNFNSRPSFKHSMLSDYSSGKHSPIPGKSSKSHSSKRKSRSRNKSTPLSTSDSPILLNNFVEEDKYGTRPRLATPPVLRDSADDVPHHRGRPRKNPPMLKPAIGDKNAIEVAYENSDSDFAISDQPKQSEKRKQRKKDKLSIFYSVARQRKNKSTSRDRGGRNSESVSQCSSDEDGSIKKSHKSDRKEKKSSIEHKQSKYRKDEQTKRKGKKHKRMDRTESPESDQDAKPSRRKHKQKRERRKSVREECFECESPPHRPRHVTSELKRRPASSMGIARSSEPRREEPLERPASTQPQKAADANKSSPDSCKESPRSIMKPQFLSIFTNKSGDNKLVNHFASPDPNSILVFPRKFCNLKPDKFWKKKKGKALNEEIKPVKKSEESPETTSAALTVIVPPVAVTPISSTSGFATKASVKELPSSHYTGGGTQLQQMLKALAASSSGTGPGGSKRKKRGPGGGSKERRSDKDEKSGGSAARNEGEENRERGEKEKQTEEVVSEDDESLSNRRRKRLGWKSKHKNVVDPVFLGELEHLMQDLASCRLDRKISSDIWPDRPSSCMPSIFKRRRIILSRKRREQGRVSKRGKSSRTNATTPTPACTSPGDQGELISPGGLDDENKDEDGRLKGEGEGGSSEQRLPLKKRHHHVQDANSKDDSDMDDIEIELEIHVSPKKLATADKPTAHSNHGGDKSQIAHSSKSSIRHESKNPTLQHGYPYHGFHSLDANNRPRQYHEIRARNGGDILSPSKLPTHRHPVTSNEELLKYSGSCQQKLQVSVPKRSPPNTSPRGRTNNTAVDFKTKRDSILPTTKPHSLTMPHAPSDSSSVANSKRPTVADRLAEKLGIPLKEDSHAAASPRPTVETLKACPRQDNKDSSKILTKPDVKIRLEQQNLVRQVGKSEKFTEISAAIVDSSKVSQVPELKEEGKQKEKHKSSRKYKVQSTEDVNNKVPRDVKPNLDVLAKHPRHADTLNLAQHNTSVSTQQLSSSATASLPAKSKTENLSSLSSKSSKDNKLLPISAAPKSPRYIDPGVRSHSSQGFRSPERARARQTLDRGRAVRAQGPWESSNRWKQRETSTPTSHNFVESIQDCIDKYTFVDETESTPPLHSRYFASSSARVAAAAAASSSSAAKSTSMSPPAATQQKMSPTQYDNKREQKENEHSIDITNDKRKEEDVEKRNDKVEESSVEGNGKGAGYVCRNSRQDLHTHLWGDERLKKSGACDANIPKEGTSSMCNFTSIEKTKDIAMQMSKPLPTEPIRRVDLGFSHKPLDKSMRFHRGQECYIKKVPQAIVAPFRRHPPEACGSSNSSSNSNTVTPIHRASIGSTVTSTSNHTNATNSISPVLSSSITTPVTTDCSNNSSSITTATASTTVTPSTSESLASTVEEVENEVTTVNKDKISAKENVDVPPPEKKDPKSDEKETTGTQDSTENIPKPQSTSPREGRPLKDADTKKVDEETSQFIPKMKRCHVDVSRLKDSDKLLNAPKEKYQVQQVEKKEKGESKSKDKCQVDLFRLKKDESVTSDVKESVKTSNLNEYKDNLNPIRPLRLRERRKTGDPKETEISDTELERPKSRLRETKIKIKDGRIKKKESVKRLKNVEVNEKVDFSLKKKDDLIVKEVETIETETKSIKLRLMKTKKRKRRPNKTGFPTKIKKKKIKIKQEDENVASKEITKVENETSDKNVNNAKPDDNLNVIDTDLLQRSLKKIEGKSLRSSVVPEVKPSKRTATESNTSRRAAVLSVKRSAAMLKEVSTKRLKLDISISGAKESLPEGQSTPTAASLSSVDPSPASSDVESSDVRMSWDDESDQDTLSLLPPSEETSAVVSSPSKRKRRTNIRKTYLKAGLFSFDYKSNNSGSEIETMTRMKGMVYKPEEHPFSLLPPPYYCGRQLRQKKEDYSLPFDIWSLHSTGVIPSRDVLTTWNYKRIKSNIYVDVKPPGMNYETPPCHCKPKLNRDLPGCLDDCINRMTYTECDPTCRLGSQCTNNAIQKHSSPAIVERFMTNEKGWGIRTKTALTAGSFIMEYVGEVVTDKEFKKRMSSEYKNDNHHYCMHFGEGLVIDGHRMGGECRFVNHSCQPNCEMQKWYVNGVYRMALFSSRYLSVDEELTYDYNFSLFNPHEGQMCKCNSHECRGVIGGKSQRVRQQLKNLSKANKQAEEKKAEKEGVVKSDKKSSKNEKQATKEPKKSYADITSEETTVIKHSLDMLSPVKPLLNSEKLLIRENSVLLCRNLDRIRKVRENYINKVNKKKKIVVEKPAVIETDAKIEAIKEEPPKILAEKSPLVLKLNENLKDFMNKLETQKDKNGLEVAKLLSIMSVEQQKTLKSEIITDLQTIHANIDNNMYASVHEFDQDVLIVFQNFMRLYGNVDAFGEAASEMRTKYLKISEEFFSNLAKDLEPEMCRYLPRKVDRPVADDPEDVIICPCRQYKDEGVMIQCETCGIWQHLDCVKPGVDPDSLGVYTCEKCSNNGKETKLDIPLLPQPEYASSGEIHYASLMREDKLHMYVGMTVYVLRAFKDKNGLDAAKARDENIVTGPGGVPHKSISPIKGPSKEAASLAPSNYPTYKTVGDSASTNDMDIFRVERLWRNETGAMFAFGYHFLRPHETFHEPSRKFYDNEVFRVPLYEVLPLDTIWRECWVLDPITFVKGRPLASQEEHVYICEYRVDKSARLFHRLAKGKDGICTKWYAFHTFDVKIKASRNFTPHEVPEDWVKAKSDKPVKSTTSKTKPQNCKGKKGDKKKSDKRCKEKLISKEQKRECLNKVLTKLLSKNPDDLPTDISYLLSNHVTKNPTEEERDTI